MRNPPVDCRRVTVNVAGGLFGREGRFKSATKSDQILFQHDVRQGSQLWLVRMNSQMIILSDALGAEEEEEKERQ